jgi:hypothetical protein
MKKKLSIHRIDTVFCAVPGKALPLVAVSDGNGSLVTRSALFEMRSDRNQMETI